MSGQSDNDARLIRPQVLIGIGAVGIFALLLTLSPSPEKYDAASEDPPAADLARPPGAADRSLTAPTPKPADPALWAELEVELSKLPVATDREAAAADLARWFRRHLPAESRGIGDWFARELRERSGSREPDPGRGYRMMGFGIFLTEWGGLAGERAIAYVQQLGAQGLIPVAHEQRVIEGWVRDNAEEAMAFLWRQPQTPDVAALDTMRRRLSYFSDAAWRDSPQAFLHWIRHVSPDWSDEESRVDPRMLACLERVGALAHGEHFAAAGELLRQHESALDYRGVLRPFAKRFANTRPADALDWALASANADQREKLASDILREVARRDPAAGIELLNGPAGARIAETSVPAARDRVVSRFIHEMVDHHGSDREALLTALASLKSIRDDSIRLTATRRVEDAIRRFHTVDALPEFHAALSGE